MEKAKNKINWLFYLNFIVATVAITEFFTSNKYFATGDSVRGYLVLSVSALIFLMSLCLMAFQIYSEEKEKNNLRVGFRLFDAVHALLNAKRDNPEAKGVSLR